MDAAEIFKKVRKIEIKTRGLSNQIFSGQYHSIFKGRGMAFSEVREYQYGDDIRNIDWNVTARFNHPYIKTFEEERELTVMLLIDVSGSNEFGTKNASKEEYITEIARSQPLTEDAIQLDVIRNAYPDMAMTLINDYIRHNPPTEVEKSLWCPILDDIYIGGTFDNRTGDILVDYKSYSSATEPTKIPFEYRIQLLAYCYMLRYNNIPINRIRLVYVNRPIDTRSISEKTGKPIGKITPPRVTVLTEVITEDDWKMITDTLTLIAESIQAVRSHPELTHIIFKSMSLKENTNGN